MQRARMEEFLILKQGEVGKFRGLVIWELRTSTAVTVSLTILISGNVKSNYKGN